MINATMNWLKCIIPQSEMGTNTSESIFLQITNICLSNNKIKNIRFENLFLFSNLVASV